MHDSLQETQAGIGSVISHIKKRHEYAEIINYMGLTVCNGIMYTTIKINGKCQIFHRGFSLDLPKRDDCLVLCIFMPICVLICCQETERLAEEQLLQMIDLELLSRNLLKT